MKDEEIKELIEKNDHNQAFRKLFQQYHKRLYWHVRKIVYTHDDADDAVQITFIKVYEKLYSFKFESSLYTWIYKIATNEALQILRKKARLNHTSFEDYSLSSANKLYADNYFDGNAASIALTKAVAKLSEQQRLVFQMKYYEEMTYEQISEVLEKTVGGLKANYHHAVVNIKKEISNFDNNTQNHEE